MRHICVSYEGVDLGFWGVSPSSSPEPRVLVSLGSYELEDQERIAISASAALDLAAKLAAAVASPSAGESHQLGDLHQDQYSVSLPPPGDRRASLSIRPSTDVDSPTINLPLAPNDVGEMIEALSAVALNIIRKLHHDDPRSRRS